jgi:hypothetical protein
MPLLRSLAALILPLFLASCFLLPGKFTSNVDVRKDGSFTVSYKGEVIFLSPNDIMEMDKKPKIWADGMALCFNSGRKETNEWRVEDLTDVDMDKAKSVNMTGDQSSGAAGKAADVVDEALEASKEADEEMRAEAAEGQDPDVTERPCTKAEIAELKKDYDKEKAEQREKKRQESEQMAQMFGLGGADDKSNQKFAAWLMKHEGWKSVTYRGEGVFDVDYRLSGKLTHDYIFPIFPKAEIIMPFVMLRSRADGAVMVSAPALGGGGMKDLGERTRGLAQIAKPDMVKSPRTEGVFTVTTDGEILTNNTTDGPDKDAAGRKLTWEVGPNMDRSPETLIRISRPKP